MLVGYLGLKGPEVIRTSRKVHGHGPALSAWYRSQQSSRSK